MEPGPESRTARLEAELAATKASLATYHNTLQHLVSELASTKQTQQQQAADAYGAHSTQSSGPLLQRSASFQEGPPQGSSGAAGSSSLPAFASMFQLSGAGSASTSSLAGLTTVSSGGGAGPVEDMHCSTGMLAAMEALSVSHNASSNTPFGLSGSLSSGALPDVGQGGPDAGGPASRMPSMHALLQQGSTELPPSLTPALSLGDRSYGGLPSSGVDKPITSAPADVAAAAAAAAAAAGGSHGLLTGLSMLNSTNSSYPAGGPSSTYTGSTVTGGERSDASWSGMRDDQGSGWGHHHHHHSSGRSSSRGLLQVSSGDPVAHLPPQQAAPLPPLHPHPMSGSGAMLQPLGLPLLHHHPHGGGVPGAGLPPGGGDLGGPRLPPAEEAALLQQHYALLMEQGGGAAMAAAAAAAGLGGMPPHPGSELLMGMGGMGMHHPGLGSSLGHGPLGHPPGSDWEQALAFANAQAANSMYAQAQLAHAHAAAAVLEQQQHALMLQQHLAAQAHYHPYAQHILALAAKQHGHAGPGGGGYPRVGSQGRLRGGPGGGSGGRNSWPGDAHRGRDTARKAPHPLLDKAPRAPRSRSDPPDWRRVFVGNIGWWVDEAALEAYFSKFGKVTDTQVMWNTKLLAKGKKVNREFAFVSFTTPEEAEAAIRGLHRVYIEGLVKDKDGLTVQYEAQGFGHTPAPLTGAPGSSSSSGGGGGSGNGTPASAMAAAGPGSAPPAAAGTAGCGEPHSSTTYCGDTWGEGEHLQEAAEGDAGRSHQAAVAAGDHRQPPATYERLRSDPTAAISYGEEAADAASGRDRPPR